MHYFIDGKGIGSEGYEFEIDGDVTRVRRVGQWKNIKAARQHSTKGAPRKVAGDDMQRHYDEYRAACEATGKEPTTSGLAKALGVSRQTARRYEEELQFGGFFTILDLWPFMATAEGPGSSGKIEASASGRERDRRQADVEANHFSQRRRAGRVGEDRP